MNKDEILEKSRAAKGDEGAENAVNKGLKWGYVSFVVVANFFVITNIWLSGNDTPKIGIVTASLLFTFAAAQCFSTYRFNKKPMYAVLGVALVLAIIALCVGFVILISQ
ncbi:MAG: DUF6442 family protein [Clostridiales bacterium]|jgi:hypothetical protein|nr:DUF6442 family protein [Clostridiales bacterium]